MGKRPKLFHFEREIIVELRKQGLSQRAIGARINRSQTVVKNFLCDQKGYGSRDKGGRPKKKVPIADERAVVSVSALRQNPSQSLAELRTKTGVQVNTQTIRGTIKKSRFGHSEKVSELIDTAVKAKEHAYAPYSKFRVGAAVLCTDGTIFSGCNVENCSYGNCICAERTALVKAVSEGYRKFEAIAITSDLKTEISPCGSCRQFMIEFGSDWDVYMTSVDRSYKKFKVSELLLLGFSPSDLNSTKE